MAHTRIMSEEIDRALVGKLFGASIASESHENSNMAKDQPSVCLRLWHPHCSPEDVNRGVGLVPQITHAIGDQRMTPIGRLLTGKYTEMFWMHRTEMRNGEDVANGIGRVLDLIGPHHVFFRDFLASGGRGELFVGVFLDGCLVLTIPQDQLRQIAELGLNLSFDIYPPERRTEGDAQEILPA